MNAPSDPRGSTLPTRPHTAAGSPRRRGVHRSRSGALRRGLATAAIPALGLFTIVAAAMPATATQAFTNPLTGAQNFTALVEGDIALGTTGAGGEIEGSVAAGGTLSFGTYNLTANSDGSALPTVGGANTQVLTGGAVNFAGANKLDLNAGYGRFADTTGLEVTADGRLKNPGSGGYVLSQVNPKQTSLAAYTSTAYSAAFPAGTFDSLRSESSALTAAGQAAGATKVGVVKAGETTLTLTPGVTNYWNVDAATVNSTGSVNFVGAVPSNTTPLVINVTGGSGDVSGIRFNGDSVGNRYFAPYVLWNFDGWSSVRLVGGTEMSGLILAPSAALDYNRSNPLRGQIIASSLTITGGGEIHHWGYTPTPEEPPVPSETVTPTPRVTETTSPTPSETVTPTPTETATPTPSETTTPTPSDTVTPTPSETVTPTPSETVTPTPSETVTPTPTSTVDTTATSSPTPSSSFNSATITPTDSPTPTLVVNDGTVSPSPSPSATTAAGTGLAQTGAAIGTLAIVGGLAALAGGLLLILRRRASRS